MTNLAALCEFWSSNYGSISYHIVWSCRDYLSLTLLYIRVQSRTKLYFPTKESGFCHLVFELRRLWVIETDLPLVVNNRRRLLNVFAENVAFDEVWKPYCQFMSDELLRWDREDLCSKIY